ncbi:MAG TPA: DEAD/DEAH box helicase [Mycobacteriales bacterium]|nr:DEAD/DEAH box helicase [Mycobacteriales bacterium]
MSLSVSRSVSSPDAGPATALLQGPGRRERLTHVEHLPARAGRTAAWPSWVPPPVRERLTDRGIGALWEHQAVAADLAWSGRHVVVATGTASGKSLAYQLPLLSLLTSASAPATALYVAPTKALASDQLESIVGLDLPGVRPSRHDGDTSREERDWARAHANLLLTNPDMLHFGLLPQHTRWAGFLRALRFVVVDECHAYRGVFGAHVAQILRRLRRICAHYGASPTFVLASATVAEPGRSASRLVGAEVTEVVDDAAPRGATTFLMWEPPLMDGLGEWGAPARRSSTAETADLLADLVTSGVRSLAFVRSRRGAEAVALSARRGLAEVAPELAGRVAAYRAGYLPEERRTLERDLRSGRLLGVAATSALELGIDVSGLDAVLMAGWPGTRASLWQQAGRAGRGGQPALAVLVARDDPLDTYVVHHPEAVFARPVEATVFDPDNPHVLGPHLCAAAAELPLSDGDTEVFGPAAMQLLPELAERGLLRRRAAGWYWTRRDRAHDLTDIRGTGGTPVRLVEAGTGRLLGTVDAAAAHSTAHEGAVYLHQGETYLVRALDLDESVALLEPAQPDHTTSAREVTEIRVVSTAEQRDAGGVAVAVGTVDVTSQVVAYLRRRLGSGEILGEVALDLPPRQLRTAAVWWTLTPPLLEQAGLQSADVPGAAHAAEHASIGLLPLFATCDRWDIGGVSTALHPDTGLTTVFVYDGHPGGAGFAERGYRASDRWLTATRDAIAACECEQGCPSCVQSPKCGNGNQPLDKSGALRLLDLVVARLG